MSHPNWKRLVFALVLIAILALGGIAQAVDWDNTAMWNGEKGVDSDRCDKLGESPERTEDGWIHWIVTQAGQITLAELELSGTGTGDYAPTKYGPVVEFFTPYFEIDGLIATLHYNGTWDGNFVISDYCAGVFEEELTVTKTAVTSWQREHKWDIAKRVETENEWELDGFPKIWLDGPGTFGDETATWTVDVTYEGYDDSGWNVSGDIKIENTGNVAATITSVDDLLGGIPFMIDCGVMFPYVLPAGETLMCSYDEDSYVEGMNVVTVTTMKGEYVADAEIIWGDPTTVINEIVNVKDINNLLGEKYLGSVTAPDDAQFTYDKLFQWIDFKDECGESFKSENTASIVETGQDAEALLKVNVRCEILDVSKTAETSFTREHKWDIDKRVETENQEFVNGTPKIWLYTDGSGDEIAKWIIDVTYEGYVDSGFNVAGIISVTNTGQLDAVITDITDLLAGEPIEINCGEGFGPDYLLKVGYTLVCSYSEDLDSKIEGENVVTVTTERDFYSAKADIRWGDPDPEHFKTVDIIDISKVGILNLGTLDADELEVDDVVTFGYSKGFAYEDFDECGSFQFDNTATIVETKQSASATLKVNVQCMLDDSAWAKGDRNTPFCGFFSNWGWTNPITPGTYTWDLWAGAAQCDTEKGTLAGRVTVVYGADGYVTVKFALEEGFALGDTHVYAGYYMFPELRNGKPTVAPGQYTNEGPFDGSEIYVIVHAVVYYPDPSFGP